MKKREPETPVRRIAVTLSASRCNSLVMEGLIRFSRSRPNWLLHMEELSVPNSRMDGLDAMVGTFPDRESVAAHSRLSALMLSVFRKPPDARIPAILVDHEAVGRMAARYFIDKGITTLAYIGRSRTGFDPRRDPHLDRYVGFQREAGTHRVIPAPEYNPWQPDSVRMIKRWLHALPHPVGLFCVGDAVAHWVSDICRMEGIPVPDHIAILGVN
ncbi:MAG: substrate-binding domain-containing protein, partial [Kiritimatiellia bacterium]|nr:substrate-binding domain-containing protein [Kiritimatiellia bacterium]